MVQGFGLERPGSRHCYRIPPCYATPSLCWWRGLNPKPYTCQTLPLRRTAQRRASPGLLSCHRYCPLSLSTRGFCRDVFNEKPSTDLMEADGDLAEDNPDALPRGAVLHTTRGDISVKLFPDECPQTVENFATHARNGYYDHVIFHRVIKGFCIQTGDPLGMPIVRCIKTV